MAAETKAQRILKDLVMGVSTSGCHPYFQISLPTQGVEDGGVVLFGRYHWTSPGWVGRILNSVLNPLKLRYLWVIQRERARKETDIQWPDHQSRVLHQRCQFTSTMTSISLCCLHVGVMVAQRVDEMGKSAVRWPRTSLEAPQQWMTLNTRMSLQRRRKPRRSGGIRGAGWGKAVVATGVGSAYQFHKLPHLSDPLHKVAWGSKWNMTFAKG